MSAMEALGIEPGCRTGGYAFTWVILRLTHVLFPERVCSFIVEMLVTCAVVSF